VARIDREGYGGAAPPRQKMEFISDDLGADEASDDQLRAFSLNIDTFRIEPRFTLTRCI
jgi:hypothetical protein